MFGLREIGKQRFDAVCRKQYGRERFGSLGWLAGGSHSRDQRHRCADVERSIFDPFGTCNVNAVLKQISPNQHDSASLRISATMDLHAPASGFAEPTSVLITFCARPFRPTVLVLYPSVANLHQQEQTESTSSGPMNQQYRCAAALLPQGIHSTQENHPTC